MTAIRGRVSKFGRNSLFAEFRKAVGLDQGGDVVVERNGSEIRITTIDEVVSRAQAITRRFLGGKPLASVDAFLAERRREESRE